MEYGGRSPLTVAMRYPEDRARVSEEGSVVAAVVTSSGAWRRWRGVNGAEVQQQTERAPPPSWGSRRR